MEQLHIQNPLLFALLHIIDAAPFNAHPFAPRASSGITRLPSLIPPNDAPLPAFSYIVTETRNPNPQTIQPALKGRVLLTIEAALWQLMPQNLQDCDWYYTTLTKYTNPDDDTEKTGLLIKDLAAVSGTLIELEAKLKAIIFALDSKVPIPTIAGWQDGAFETAFGFKREGDIICKAFTDTSSAQLLGVVARFQLWMKDNTASLCDRCGWHIDLAQLTTSALETKIGVTSLKDCL